ncbi:hypothetical protein J7E49_06755 [Variovorax paradoxus]|nr:hypothetical protein [Variovorax paradoxus]
MNDRPLPLTPADCNLQDFEHMQLYVRRLRDSRFASHTSGDGFRAGLLLWSASWHQLPAASVPNDDIELAQLTGYGRVAGEFIKVRAEALYGFVLCSDGRWYHPIVAKTALGAWEQKLAYGYKKFADRLRKEFKAKSIPADEMPPIPSLEQWKHLHFPATAQFEALETSPTAPAFPLESSGIPSEESGTALEKRIATGSRERFPPEKPDFPLEEFKLSGGTVLEFQRKTLLEGEGEGEGYINTPLTPQGGKRGRSRKPTEEPSEFVAFYAAYPRKVSRQAALKAWLDLKPDPALQATIMAALASQCPHLDFREGGRFIPHASTWLNQGRWADELRPAASAVGAGVVGVERKPWEGAK